MNHRREEWQRETYQAVRSHLQQNTGEDDRARRRGFDVGVWQPGVEGKHGNLDGEGEEEAEEEEVKKPAKAKALTQKDVEAVCKAHARKHGFETTKALLAKKFKTSSIGKIDPENYAAVVAAVKI